MLSKQELRRGEWLRFGLRLLWVCGLLLAVIIAGAGWHWRAYAWHWLLYLCAPACMTICHSALRGRCNRYYLPLLERELHSAFTHFKPGEFNSFHIGSLDQTGLVKSGDICRCYRSFFGTYRGLPFCWSDMYYHTQFGLSDRRNRTHFRGIWLTIERPVTFEHPVIVSRRAFSQSRGMVSAGQQVHEIELSDPAFGRQFQIFSSDKHWAAYLLDSELCRKLTSLQEHSAGRLTIAFVEHQVHVACFAPPRCTVVPLFGGIHRLLEQFEQEQIAWVHQVLDTLWPAA